MVLRRAYGKGLVGEAMEEQPAGMVAPAIEVADHLPQAQSADTVLLVRNHMARSHIRNGLRVSCTTVRAVSDTCRSRARQCSSLRDIPSGPPPRGSGGRQSHPTKEAAGCTHGTPFRCQTKRRTLECPRVIDPSDRMSWAFHPPTLSLVATCAKGIPNSVHR